MSKPSYAAVAASPTSNTKQNQASQSTEPTTDAPPPYTGPSQLQPQPPRAHFASPPQTSLHSHQSYQSANNVEGQQIQEQGGWTPPPNLAVARSRAQRRFWSAFIWAWLIWIAIGLVIGGGVTDVERNPPGRHGHWGKHGRWHDDQTIYPIATENIDVQSKEA